MASRASIVRHSDELDWDSIDGCADTEGVMRWKALIGRSQDQSEGMACGLCEVPPGTRLEPHHHAEAEIYYVFEGSGEMLLGDEVITLRSGSVVYIPGDVTHGLRNTTDGTMRFLWIFPVDRYAEAVYHMDEKEF